MSEQLFRWVKASERIQSNDRQFVFLKGCRIDKGILKKENINNLEFITLYYNTGFQTKELTRWVVGHEELEEVFWLESIQSDSLIEALEDFLSAVPPQTDDADWWPDNLSKAVERAKMFLAQYQSQPGSLQRDKIEPNGIIRMDIHRVMEELGGEGFWKICSGCHESEDGHDVEYYPYSETFKCKLGAGCHECGGIGAIWEYHPEESQSPEHKSDREPEEDKKDLNKEVAELGEDLRKCRAWNRYEDWKKSNYEFDSYYDKFYKIKDGKLVPFSSEYTEMDLIKEYSKLNNL